VISYQPACDLSKSAEITYNNMRPYYEHYLVDWEQPKILEQILNLDNWDILSEGEVVGAIRLSFDSDEGYLRGLQVNEEFQKKGIGAAALGNMRSSRAERLNILKSPTNNQSQMKIKLLS
jgi:GNAT superfamily N-acetyltransferase